MAFGNKSDQEAMSEINVTPLVDVMLVLLVVFIVTAPLLTQSVRVDLPKTVATGSASQEQGITLSIDARGQLFLDQRAISLDALGQELRTLQQQNPEITVRFNADAGVPYGKVAETMAVVHQAGISKLAFLTREQ